MLQLPAQRVDIVGRDAEAPRLAAELPHAVGEHLRVGVVDLRRPHRIAWRDDLVAGRDDRDDRLSPDIDFGHANRREHAGVATGEQLSAAKHRLAGVMSVPANEIPLPAVTALAMRSSPSRASACSTMTTASAPRGTMPPVAICAASPEWIDGSRNDPGVDLFFHQANGSRRLF